MTQHQKLMKETKSFLVHFLENEIRLRQLAIKEIARLKKELRIAKANNSK